MYIFAIESSCDETSASVIRANDDNIEVLSNIIASQVDTHALYGGVVPEIASRAHCEVISSVSHEAIDKAGISLSDIDAAAVTFAPGLIGPLLVGVNFVKALAYRSGCKIIPVQHIEGHLSAAYIENSSLKPPFLALAVSGGHTSLYKVENYVDFDEIGSTRDDACGEAFDKVGRVMGLPYPGGAAMDKLASEAYTKFDYTKKDALTFPSPAVHDETYDFSFSGLKTAVINHIHNEKQKAKTKDLPYETKCEIAGAFTNAVCSGITKKVSAALKDTGMKTLVMAGGVAANSHLRRAVRDMCDSLGVEFVVPSLSLCGDNAAMIAARAYHMYRNKLFGDIELDACASDDGAEEYLDRIKSLARLG